MDLRVKFFQLFFPAPGFKKAGFIGQYFPGFNGDDVNTGAEMFAKLFQQGQACGEARANIVQVEGQEDAPELLEDGYFGHDQHRAFKMLKQGSYGTACQEFFQSGSADAQYYGIGIDLPAQVMHFVGDALMAIARSAA